MDLETKLSSADPEVVLNGLDSITTLESEPSSSLLEALTGLLSTHPQLSDRICEGIAQFAKQDDVRTWAASDGRLIPQLVPLLDSESLKVQVQALRAIGNLCFEQDVSREQFHSLEGCPLLIKLLKKCSTPSESIVKLTTVTCGCILNVCCDNDKLSKALYELGALDHLLAILLLKGLDQAAIGMTLKALSVLIDAESCDVGALSTSNLPAVLIHLLKESQEQNFDVTEEVLELISDTLLEGDERDASFICWIKALSQETFIRQLLAITGPECLIKATNLIIQIVSDDTTMESLFQSGFVLDWARQVMNSTDESCTPELKASAVLVVGNMARNDSNCQAIYKMGIAMELLNLLKVDEHIKLQFAVLSALRNLSLPEAHKLLFLKDGIVEKAVKVLKLSSDPNVIMKALGCLRLLSVTPETCQYLVVSEPVVERVLNAYDESSLPHIKTEASRLIASIIKNTSSHENIIDVIKGGGVPCLLYLLSCDHKLLVNEGIVALTVATALKNDAVFQHLMDSQCIDSVQKVLQTLDDAPPQMIENCFVLLTGLCHSEAIKALLSSSEELKSLTARFESHGTESVREKCHAFQECLN